MLIYIIVAIFTAALFIVGRKYQWDRIFTEETSDDYLGTVFLYSCVWPITIPLLLPSVIAAGVDYVWKYIVEWMDE